MEIPGHFSVAINTLATIFPEPEERAAWMLHPRPAYPFAGRPIDFISRGLNELIQARLWLEGQGKLL